MDRRSFLRTSAYVSAGALAGARLAFAADADTEITPQDAGPEISPYLRVHALVPPMRCRAVPRRKHDNRFVRTPVYHIFEMYRSHTRSQLAQMHIRCDELQVPSANGTAAMPGLSGSASVNGKAITVTITNPSLDSTVAARIRLTSGSIVEGRARFLTHTDMTAGNKFDHPEKIKLTPFSVAVPGSKAEVSLPPRAVVSLELITA